MECLDETTVLALLAGELPGSEAAAKRAHLGDCDACRAVVAELARAAPEQSGTAFAATAPAWGSSEPASDLLADDAFAARLAPGTLLDGRYRVERILGSGGMGVVALTTHETLGQQLAIKLLHPRGLTSPEVVARFVREARAAVRVQSEHVVKVVDVASLESGEPYIVMEYLVGRDARAWLDARGPLPLRDVAELVGQACLGVGEAHRAGVVHRDLKPANLFVVERAGAVLVKVLDFGVSKMRRDELSEVDVSLTRSTSFLGTPLYMSPEQVRAARDVDARADVWALGCILYELSTGRSPFRRGSLGETCAAILVEDPDVSGLPRELVPIVTRCLSREPSARYADGFALARALAPLAGPATREEIERAVGVEAERPRRRGWLALAAVLLAITGVGVAWLSPRKEQPPVAPPVAAAEPSPPLGSASVVVPSVTAPLAPSPSMTSPPRAPVVIKSAPAPSPSPSAAPSAAPSVSVSKPLNPEFGDRM